jgi:hypothetical protein
MTDANALVRDDLPGPERSGSDTPAGLGQRSLRQAIQHLGGGFLTANPTLVEALADERLTLEAFWEDLVRTTLQLLIVVIAEDRDLLVKATVSREGRRRYDQQCSMAALRQPPPAAETAHASNLWQTRTMVLDTLTRRHGVLFTRTGGPWGAGFLRGHRLPNADLRAAAHLLTTPDLATWGAPQLGEVREALLELTPQLDGNRFTVRAVTATRRLDRGIYYTPVPVSSWISRRALDLAIDQLNCADDPAELLRIQAVDPACGAGVFLVAAAHQLAGRYAALLAGNDDPPPAAVRFALPIVMRECVYGIDIDPVAVDLARTALWLEVAAARTHPMSFMDGNVICANALESPDCLPEALRPAGPHSGAA